MKDIGYIFGTKGESFLEWYSDTEFKRWEARAYDIDNNNSTLLKLSFVSKTF
jgi:hypothetical protein